MIEIMSLKILRHIAQAEHHGSVSKRTFLIF